MRGGGYFTPHPFLTLPEVETGLKARFSIVLFLKMYFLKTISLNKTQIELYLIILKFLFVMLKKDYHLKGFGFHCDWKRLVIPIIYLVFKHFREVCNIKICFSTSYLGSVKTKVQNAALSSLKMFLNIALIKNWQLLRSLIKGSSSLENNLEDQTRFEKVKLKSGILNF